MPADALAPKASAGMVMAVQDRQHVLLFHSLFYLLSSSQMQDMIQNVNTSFIIFVTCHEIRYFAKKYRYDLWNYNVL